MQGSNEINVCEYKYKYKDFTVLAGHLFGKFLLLQLGAQVLVAGLKLFGGGGQGLVGVRQGLQMKLGFLQTGLGLMQRGERYDAYSFHENQWLLIVLIVDGF